MILSPTDIVRIIKENPGKQQIASARSASKRLRLHLYGEGLDTHLQEIPGFEAKSMRNVRAKYAKSNKDLFSRLTRPVDKVFTAKGGSSYYNLPDEQERRARQLMQSLPGGTSVRKWIETTWKPHLMDDPGGVLLIELLPREEAIQARDRGEAYAYPTYRSSATIYDYQTTGTRVEWIAFSLTSTDKEYYGIPDKEQAYRLIDDAADYIVKKTEFDDVLILERLTLENYFGRVPAMRNSDLADPANDGQVLSFIDPVVELAESFLLDGSIRRVHKFMHGFPKYVEFASECPECRGTGFKEAKSCDHCGGTGKKATIRVNDIKLLSWPGSREEAVIMPADAAAYISPDKTYFDISTADLADLESAMHVTLWGSQAKVQTTGMTTGADGTQRTATEVMDEMKPEADRLAAISEMAEVRHKFITDMILRVHGFPGYENSSINYGRRYLLESPDAVLARYQDARAKGAPKSVLDTLLNEYYDTNYQADPVGLAIAKKLMYVEPFIHLSEQQLKALMPGEADWKAKLYFSEWLATVNEATLLSSTVQLLRDQLYAFAGTKQLPEPPKPLPSIV